MSRKDTVTLRRGQHAARELRVERAWQHKYSTSRLTSSESFYARCRRLRRFVIHRIDLVRCWSRHEKYDGFGDDNDVT